MPRAKERSSEGLSLALKNSEGFFTPGSKVVGDVLLTTDNNFAIGSVVVELYGRGKVHFIQSHGEGESHWRGRAPLFSQQAILYEGYHTHKPGAFSWPFQLEIPASPDVAVVRESKHQWAGKEHFLSTDDYVSSHLMPPTFKYFKWGFGYRFHAFVEYVLVATIKEAKGTSSVRLSTKRAMLPLVVRNIATSQPTVHSLPLNIEFRIPSPIEPKPRSDALSTATVTLHAETVRHTVKSSRLLLWNREATNSFQRSPSLSFSNSIRERTRSVFNPNSLPRFTFDVTVSTPESIQILDEKGMPFTVSAVPINRDEKTTIPPERYPDLHIDHVSLSIKAVTYLRWKGMFSERATTADFEMKLLDQCPVNHDIVMFRGNLSMQNSPDWTNGENREQMFTRDQTNSIDLLKLLGPVAVMREHTTKRNTEKPLPPTFHSYNVSREYELSWRLELDVAGEKIKIDSNGSRPITVLDPRKEDFEAFAKTADFLKGKQTEDNENEDESERHSQGSESARTSTTGGSVDTKSRLRRLISRTKSAEAAEEAAAARGEMTTNPPSGPAFQYQPGEMLPMYQPGPSNFGYRNEIDEEPPRYAKE